MIQTNVRRFCLAALLAVALSSCTSAQVSQHFAMTWHSINSGGGAISSASYRIDGTVGQALAGSSASTNFVLWTGFWYPTGSSGSEPVPVSTLDEAKTLADGTRVSVTGKIATTYNADFGSAGFLYIEEPDRSSGIRVVPQAMPGGLQRGKTVTVIGTMATTDDYERQIASADVTVTADPLNVLTPVGMNNKALVGGNLGDPVAGLGQYGVADGTGINSVGLLIRTWGMVTEKATGYLIISDGSGVTVRVDTTGLAGLPNVDDYATVTGISSLYISGADRLRQVLPRDALDIQ